MLNKDIGKCIIFLVALFILGLVFEHSSYLKKELYKPAHAQYTPPTYDSSEWFMAGANPQRTSHVDSTPENQTEIKGNLNVEWYVPIEPYIPYYFPV
ncbi:hypothetical protein COV24_02540, partial [candidate division WWE3 bacterium CG10_big_fil_rev_8_21_14_0_10_32_10]